MPKKHTVRLGKIVRHISRLRGGGSALPGLLIEKLEPTFLPDALATLPHGVVLVSGTNGKTTTTKMIAGLLAACGLRVFTNRSGSNFTRGIVSALIESMDIHGNLPFDIAVLELDEAHAVHFVKQVQPRTSVFLNVARDQLDRFGEIDQTARLLQKVVAQTTEAVILNRDDPLVRNLASFVPKTTTAHYFGVDASLAQLFPSDENLYASTPAAQTKLPKADVVLAAFNDQQVTFDIGNKTYKTDVKINGFYNFLNGAAALAAARQLCPDAKTDTLLKTLATIEPAFGRGEQIMFNGQPVEIVLVKNPSGFRLALASAREHIGESVMIAINDNYADGRDMSWLWDVDFSTLASRGVAMVSGIRAYDMALRLQYDDVRIQTIETDLTDAFKQFLTAQSGKPMRIFCTYTAMLRIRALAQKSLNMERAL